MVFERYRSNRKSHQNPKRQRGLSSSRGLAPAVLLVVLGPRVGVNYERVQKIIDKCTTFLLLNMFNTAGDLPGDHLQVERDSGKTRKGGQTRARILETALRLFREQGYEKTTMRAIAAAGGVSLGSAYYYFESKEHLVQAFYLQTHLEHLAACQDILQECEDLTDRLLGVVRAKIETAMPYHRFSAILFRTAVDPHSPLSPFSQESEPVREKATALFREVVEGACLGVGDNLKRQLPQLLWLYQMGIILFWIHDRSPDCSRTHQLIERSVEIVCRLICLANFPLFRPLIKSTLDLLAELRETSPLVGEGGRNV